MTKSLTAYWLNAASRISVLANILARDTPFPNTKKMQHYCVVYYFVFITGQARIARPDW